MEQYVVASMDLLTPDTAEIIRRCMPEGFKLVTLTDGSLEDRLRITENCDFIITATGAVPTQVIKGAKKLRMIQHQGVGVDKTDIETATERGIEVCITPEGTSIGVSEHVILLILAVYKHLYEVADTMFKGGFPMWEMRGRSHQLYGKTVGLVGFGRIAIEVSKRLRAFRSEILFYDSFVHMSEEEQDALGVRQVETLDELLSRSDVVSLHVPLLPETRGIANKSFFAKMKSTAILINTARGDLVVEQDFFDAVNNHVIAGAGIDVYSKEPLPKESGYRALPNVILTPHISAGTVDALETKITYAFANIQRFLRGEATHHSVNGTRLAKG